MAPTIKSDLCETFGIKYPVVLAGMAKVSNAQLAAAVTNAGGLGVIGGVSYTVDQMRRMLKELKDLLDDDKKHLFGVDLLIPAVGGSARKTNKDYTKGKLAELIDVICEAKPCLFVVAVGTAPTWIVEKLHANGIKVMNMIGSPKHVPKVLEAGVDMICAQGSAAGGHTGDIGTIVLIPEVAAMLKGKKSKLGNKVLLLAAGGIADGSGIASAFALGADGVWVGTRFIMAHESGASMLHRKMVKEANSSMTMRTIAFTGRPVRIITPNKFATEWEKERKHEMEQLASQGIIAYKHAIDQARAQGKPFNIAETFPQYGSQGSGLIHRDQSAKEIVEEMMTEACDIMTRGASLVIRQSAL